MKPVEKHSVLIVDDEESNLLMLETLLGNKYNIFKALDGVEALECLEKNQIDLILSDQIMPKMKGNQLFEKSLQKYPETIRIIISASIEVENILEAINKGKIYQFIPKPWNAKEVIKIVEDALNEKIRIDNERHELIKKLTKINQKLKNKITQLAHSPVKTQLETVSTNEKMSESASHLQKAIKELGKLQSELIRAEKKEIYSAMVVTTNHSINQHLTTILGNLQLLQIHTEKNGDSKTIEKYIDKIREASFKITQILIKLRSIDNPRLIEYSQGIQMVDIEELDNEKNLK
ncbi:response regulator [bacterium]|nr:response regulator [bacterium]